MHFKYMSNCTKLGFETGIVSTVSNCNGHCGFYVTLLGEAFHSGLASDKGLHNSDRFYLNFYSPGAYYQC